MPHFFFLYFFPHRSSRRVSFNRSCGTLPPLLLSACWNEDRRSDFSPRLPARGVKLQLTPGVLPLSTQLSEPPLGGTAEYLSDLSGEWKRPAPPARGGQERLSLGLGLPI